MRPVALALCLCLASGAAAAQGLTGVTQSFVSPTITGTPTFSPALSAANGGTGATTFPATNPNVLINSAMEVDQANEGASVSLSNGGGNYIGDGWQTKFDNASAVVSAQRVADAPSGFTNSVKVTVGTGAAVGASDDLFIQQPIEADNITDMAPGTASAANLCLSWWVKSSIGSYVYGVSLQNFATTRSFVSNRTVASAATWTQDSFCLAGDVTGAWVTSGTAGGLRLRFNIAAGSTLQGTNNAWQGVDARTGPSPTNTVLSTNGATFQVTGVKLEISPVVTAYKRAPFWQELSAAQRYFAKTFPPGTAPAQNAGKLGALCNQASVATAGTFDALWTFPQIMRISPTITTFNPSAANANIRDVIGGTDIVVNVDPGVSKSQTSVEIGSQTTALVAGNSLCIQAQADARL